MKISEKETIKMLAVCKEVPIDAIPCYEYCKINHQEGFSICQVCNNHPHLLKDEIL